MNRIRQFACFFAVLASPAFAHADILLNSSSSTSIGGTQNFTPGISGSPATSMLQLPFTDANGQTMNYFGTSTASAEYGSLHSTSSASITNDLPFDTDIPNTGVTYGTAEFEDTLTFAGAIPQDYHAQYYFLIQGTFTHTGAQTGSDSGTQASIDFSDGDDDDSMVYAGSKVAGNSTDTVNDLWKPDVVDLDGALTQDIDITFQTEVVLNTNQNVNGANFSYAATFQDTLTLAGIDVVDDNGNSLDPSLWSVTSASGTQYPIGVPAPTPEPATLGITSFTLLTLLTRRRWSA